MVWGLDLIMRLSKSLITKFDVIIGTLYKDGLMGKCKELLI